MKRKLEVLIFTLWFGIAILLYLGYHKKPNIEENIAPKIPISDIEKRFPVRKVTVISGNMFDITMRDNTRIIGNLPLKAVDNAKEKVIDFINHSINPMVVLHEKQSDGHWTIDLFFTVNEKEVNLSEWLVFNNLVYK